MYQLRVAIINEWSRLMCFHDMLCLYLNSLIYFDIDSIDFPVRLGHTDDKSLRLGGGRTFYLAIQERACRQWSGISLCQIHSRATIVDAPHIESLPILQFWIEATFCRIPNNMRRQIEIFKCRVERHAEAQADHIECSPLIGSDYFKAGRA